MNTAEFFNVVHGAAAEGYLTLNYKNGSFRTEYFDDLDAAADRAVQLADHYDVYYSCGRRAAVLEGGARGGTEDVICIGSLWADVDYGADGHKKKNLPKTFGEAIALVHSFPVRPSLILCTGGGLHPYWLLTQTWVFADADDRRRAQDLMNRLKAMWNQHAKKHKVVVDPVMDLARVLRPVNTFNRKNPDRDPVAVEVIEFDDSIRYTVDELEQLLPPLPATEQPKAEQTSSTNDLNDDAILDRAREATNGRDFSRLWNGVISDHGNDHSAADLALCNHLAFWFGRDKSRMDRTFRRSGLMREKWDERHSSTGQTYGELTLDKAIASCRDSYDPKKQRGNVGTTEHSEKSDGSQLPKWKPKRLTQQANAERLIIELAGNARFNVARGEWMIYSGGRFALDDRGEVSRTAKRVARRTWKFTRKPPCSADAKACIKHAVDSEKASGISAMMKLAQTESGMPLVPADLDRDGQLLNLVNGTVHLPSGELRPHRREDLLSKQAPICFDPNSPRPLFDAFMQRIMAADKSMIDYLARIAGVSMAGESRLQELFICYGTGANGKNVLLDTLCLMLGDYACYAPDSLLVARSQGQEHPTEIAKLCGIRLAFANEIEQSAKLRVQLVKRLTGDTVLTGRFMHRDFFDFPRTHTLVMATNNRPIIGETTHAIWRRVRLIPFNVTIPENERDPDLTEKLKSEWPGILNWALAGYRDYLANGMQTPDAVKVATKEYQQEQDVLKEYIEERVIRGEKCFVGRSELYADYSKWCEKGAREPEERNTFYDNVRQLKDVADDDRKIHGNKVRGFVGIGLADLSAQYRQAQESVAG